MKGLIMWLLSKIFPVEMPEIYEYEDMENEVLCNASLNLTFLEGER